MSEDDFVLVIAVVPASERDQVFLSDNAYHTAQQVTRDELVRNFPDLVHEIAKLSHGGQQRFLMSKPA